MDTEFAAQIAKQYHHVMVSQHVYKSCFGDRSGDNNNSSERTIMEGKYTINVTRSGVIDSASSRCLRREMMSILERDKHELVRGNETTTTLTGYTRARCIDNNGVKSIYYAHPSYRGSPWYDWAFVHFLERGEENYYPSLILGFIEVDGEVEALIQCSTRPVQWSTVERNMFVAFTLGDNAESFVRVPLSSLVLTLCVVEDYGGQKNKYFVVLPRSGWGKFFGRDIDPLN